jgi:asparagine synthase (glutamine-hydrolysing)
MCGIAGILTRPVVTADALEAQARRMIAPIAHRGPDDADVWVDAGTGAALGFRRLAILDVSPLGRQPMWSPSRRYVAVFNGEVYNFAALRRDLEADGYSFRGGSDTEVILAAFDRWGIDDAVPRFGGMFAIAVWDTASRELSLVRDRLGKKPLYVYAEPGLVTFGSELKALMAGPSFDRGIDREALAAYLRYLYVPAPRTIFRRAIKVPAAHILTIADPSRDLPEPRPYWSLRAVAHRGLAHPIADERDAVAELDDLVGDAVRVRMRADVPLGALLSGGIDSSTVVALMQEASTRPIKTYTIGFDDRAFDEAAHAARVARHLGTDHTELAVGGADVRRLIPALPAIFDEPFADPSQLPTLLVSELARRHVTVALCGDGGDELFAGYNRYVFGTRVLPRVDRLPRRMRAWLASGVARLSSERLNRLGPRVGERVHKIADVMSAESVGDMYRTLMSAWKDPGRVLIDAPEPASPACDALAAFDDGAATLLDRMMLSDQQTYLPDDLLAKVDRASMAVSLEVRAPLLDHRVVEFSWRLPRSLKLRGTTGKWILRQLLYRRVPPALVDRPKMGFSVPIDRWLRGPLKEWAADLLSPDAVARGGLLDGAAIGRAWRDLLEGRRQAGAAVWAVAMFQAWAHAWQQ